MPDVFDLGPLEYDRPDAATLREQIVGIDFSRFVRLYIEGVGKPYPSFTASISDAGIADAVMAVLAEHGLIEREEHGDG